MRNAKARMIVAGIDIALLCSISLYGKSVDSTLIEDSFRAQPPAWQLKEHAESTGEQEKHHIFQQQQYSPEILAAAEKYDVSPVLIDAVFVEENDDRPVKEDWKDDIALAWNKSLGSLMGYTIDASLGVGQVNMSTAQFLDTKYKRPSKTREELEEALQDPVQNIDYVAMNLAYLTHRKNRQPVSGNILDDPHLVAVIGTEYVRGPKGTPLEEAEISKEGGIPFAIAVGMIPTQEIHERGSAIIDYESQNDIYKFARRELEGCRAEVRQGLVYEIFFKPDSISGGM